MSYHEKFDFVQSRQTVTTQREVFTPTAVAVHWPVKMWQGAQSPGVREPLGRPASTPPPSRCKVDGIIISISLKLMFFDHHI